MSTRTLIEQVLEQHTFAIVGASRDPEKFGFLVYKTVKDAGYTVYPVNPSAETIDGDPCYPSLDTIPGPIDCVVTITPPAITEEIVVQAGHLHVPYIWMQPGSESNIAFNLARSASMQIVSGGPCIMISIAGRRERHAGGI